MRIGSGNSIQDPRKLFGGYILPKTFFRYHKKFKITITIAIGLYTTYTYTIHAHTHTYIDLQGILQRITSLPEKNRVFQIKFTLIKFLFEKVIKVKMKVTVKVKACRPQQQQRLDLLFEQCPQSFGTFMYL